MPVDYRLAQRASRRQGVKSQKFKLDVPLATTCWRKTRLVPRRLDRAQAHEIRTWAQREGWGQSQQRQAAILAPRYRVGTTTIVDVLRNMSWFDASYVPGHCDRDYWGRLTPFVAMLRLMQPQQKAVA